MPTSESLRKTVEDAIQKWGISDCIYENCTKEFSLLKLKELKEIDQIRIVRPFLLTWGQMGRWLGDVGVERVFQKLKEEAFAARIEPLRQNSLLLTGLENPRLLIIDLFDELMQTEFRSESEKRPILKTLRYTTTSKVLHLCCPDFFVMWDANIRAGYHKRNGNGEDYFQFLIEMKEFWKKYNHTIEELDHTYHIRPTRIIDIYNWTEYTGKKKTVLRRT